MRVELASRAYVLGLPALPGLSPDESDLALQWIATRSLRFDLFSVNVPIGQGDTSAPSISAAVDRMWATITRRKIDVVVWRTRLVLVVEAKVHARMKAATQVFRYVDDFHAEHPDVAAVFPVIVCRSAVPGLRERLFERGGSLFELPAAPASHEAHA
jgi:hypothetical protein